MEEDQEVVAEAEETEEEVVSEEETTEEEVVAESEETTEEVIQEEEIDIEGDVQALLRVKNFLRSSKRKHVPFSSRHQDQGLRN